MVAKGCTRCHSQNAPRRPIRPGADVWICLYRRNCRRRQAALYRTRRRTMHKVR